MAVGDFNEDGNQDVVIRNQLSLDDFVSIFLGDGAGGFNGEIQVPDEGDQTDLIIGDFDNDGHQDIITIEYSASKIRVHHGDGSGDFSTEEFLIMGVPLFSLAEGNFSNNGLKNIAVSTGSNTVRVYDNSNFENYESKTFEYPVLLIETGDFDEDGIADLAAINTIDQNVSIYLGTASSSIEFPIGNYAIPKSLAIGDFNEDGHQDIVTASLLPTSNSVSILLGDGSGSFGSSIEIPSANGVEPVTLALGDSNGDGHQDIYIADRITNGIITFFGNGTGNFTESSQQLVLPPSYNATGIVTGDFNNDEKQDLAVTHIGINDVMSIFLGKDYPIEIFGNNILIEDGDISPSLSDGTDFGSFAL